jgi:hypothetical protein
VFWNAKCSGMPSVLESQVFWNPKC